jgi:arginase
MSREIPLIGYACGLGAGNVLCAQGPIQMRQSGLLTNKFIWQKIFTPLNQQTKYAAVGTIAAINHELAELTRKLGKIHQFFVTLGGDHSSALGTWGGIAAGIAPKTLGLLWIDAHLDSHTIETSPSGNIHGMPLAALLGYGDSNLTKVIDHQPRLLPENICVLGVRSYEQEERELLERLKVKIYYMDEISNRGFIPVFTEAIEHISKNTDYYGISLDLDAISPEEAPGVGTPVAGGIETSSLFEGFQQLLVDPRFIAFEISEFNPSLDREQKTEKLIAHLLKIVSQRNTREAQWKRRSTDQSNWN